MLHMKVTCVHTVGLYSWLQSLIFLTHCPNILPKYNFQLGAAMAKISIGETLFPQACNYSVFRGVRDLPSEARAAYISKFV